jgi:hypothetical protein
MVDLRSSGFMGQDDPTTGVEDSTSIHYGEEPRSQAHVDSMRIKVANQGLAYYTYTRFFTDTFQAELAKLKNINPDFQAVMYFHYAHIPTGSPGVARPLHQARQTLLDGRRVKTTPTDGSADVVAFRQDAAITAYWANYGTGTGASYAVDYDLIDEEIELYVSAYNNAEHKPVGIKIDYFNQGASGYYEFDTAQRDSIDLDQDDVAFGIDANEQTVYAAFQDYWAERLHERFGNNMIIMANGRGSIEQPSVPETADMAPYLHGWFFEGFPDDTPFLSGTYNDPDDSFEILYDQYNGTNDYRKYGDRSRSGPFFMTDLRNPWVLSGTHAKLGRAAALLFDGYWRYRPIDGSGNIVVADVYDDTWFEWVDELGPPGGEVVKTEDGNNDVYTRSFLGGDLVVTLNRTASGISQYVSVTIDGVAQ